MTSTVVMGLILVIVGSISVLLRHQLSGWAKRYFSRFGDLGAGLGTLAHPNIYAFGGGLFVVIGIVLLIYTLMG